MVLTRNCCAIRLTSILGRKTDIILFKKLLVRRSQLFCEQFGRDK